ncbi:succinate dehydrogenase, cytochrome b556 subunit [Thioalkalivibrio sp. HK1]|uniref:succinate dehydrogenase, cytochrome b556 subunit n=1 Tax=Thioalkalivibrio sp. HK1 TaxID=1469245 RepID=UPI00046F986D|nr:succinate dehydrogenase, cytochrome b556 subunit [Thioalkalivibrio sp. HK1]
MNRHRPTSPHLQIYRLPLVALISISHRITGVILVAGAIALVGWLAAIASGAEIYACARAFLGSLVGRLLLFAFTFSFFFHFANGIRHLFWDTGAGFALDSARKSGIAVIAFAVVMTVLAWILGYAMR